MLHNLSPEDSAVAAISKGLFYLDSRALAALLKELHKVGLSNRWDQQRELRWQHEAGFRPCA